MFLPSQGFPQVLRTWEAAPLGGGAPQNVMGGCSSQKMGGPREELKMLSKNTCEGVHLIVKLPAISLQASKFTKNELLQTYFSMILARF